MTMPRDEPGVAELAGYWPLAALRLRLPVTAPDGTTGNLELRLPDAGDLAALAALAEAGVHDPAVQPFAMPWTDVGPTERARSVLQFHWRCLGNWTADNWTLNLVVVRDGVVVGTQGMTGRDFAVVREVGTGSWLGRQHQGQGIGTAMRTAVLALAFDRLGAEYALSGAFTHNLASLGVSRKLGYADDGMERHAIRGRAAEERRFRIERATWAARGAAEPGAAGPWPGDVAITGLAPCLPLFGVAADGGA
jgi:RimJ/RimL family protein N-acetyltransferase